METKTTQSPSAQISNGRAATTDWALLPTDERLHTDEVEFFVQSSIDDGLELRSDGDILNDVEEARTNPGNYRHYGTLYGAVIGCAAMSTAMTDGEIALSVRSALTFLKGWVDPKQSFVERVADAWNLAYWFSFGATTARQLVLHANKT